MANKETKKLTSAELVKKNEKLDEVQEFVVNIDGEDYLLTHDVVFRKSKQFLVIDDIIALFEAAQNRIEILDVATAYVSILILKHFTSLDVSDDIDEAIKLLNILVDLGALDKLMNALPEDQVIKMFDLVSEVVKNFEENIVLLEKEAEELSDKVENEEVKGLIESGESNTASEGETE
ncbi:hypothetical protein IEN91_04550 [Bacillus velezensis]|uniref:hypothetical protein n=1 Tax=Bacillus velezensis TaxID=492670 RepID=UPI0018C7E058|nr:hypothetical protein [Bacillus velezensis]QPK89725.1 hypothetical protein IEN91_04550 [Bacillus velezensis]